MLNVPPRLKRTVAREWLVFLALIIVSPALVNLVHWKNQPVALLLPEHSNIFDRLEQSADDDAYRTEDYVEHPERLERAMSEDGTSAYRSIPRRFFPDYLAHKMKHPSAYLNVLYVYPIYLLLCSIIWAVKMLKRKEPIKGSVTFAAREDTQYRRD
jgi:hypothetical protein